MDRGFGARPTRDVKAGEFVIEYVGEVIDETEYQRRLVEYSANGAPNYYLFKLTANLTMDAGPRGSLARFINHSCNPNCISEKWTVGGATRVGIFATQDIAKGTELTYNYNWVGFEGSGPSPNRDKGCRCGAANCSGTLGERPKKKDETNQKDKAKKKVAGKKRAANLRQIYNAHMKSANDFKWAILQQFDACGDPYADFARERRLYLNRSRSAGFNSMLAHTLERCPELKERFDQAPDPIL
jgi:hypothetical protein